MLSEKRTKSAKHQHVKEWIKTKTSHIHYEMHSKSSAEY